MLKRATIAVVLLGAVIVLVRVFPVLAYALAVMSGLEGLGLLGAVLYGIAFGVLASAFVPGSLMSMLAGATWGVAGGVMVIAPGCALASFLSAALGRTLLREPTLALVDRYPALAALDRVIGDDAFRVVTLLRLSPILPFAVSNYGLGTTSASLRAITAGTLVGIVPITTVWVYLGSIAGDAVKNGVIPDSPLHSIMLVSGLFITAAIAVWLGRRAKQQLDQTRNDSKA